MPKLTLNEGYKILVWYLLTYSKLISKVISKNINLKWNRSDNNHFNHTVHVFAQYDSRFVLYFVGL